VLTVSDETTGADLVLLPVAGTGATTTATKAAAAPSNGAGRGGRTDAAGDSPVEVYAQTPFNESSGTVSPDGRWLAYASDESGVTEVYVDTFPLPGHRARVSVGGGTEPRWTSRGGTLLFRRGAELHRVRLTFEGGVPLAASSERLFAGGADIRSYDVATDGRRFLLNLPTHAPRDVPLTALVNVRSLLPSAQ
jgi:hypothetical protein